MDRIGVFEDVITRLRREEQQRNASAKDRRRSDEREQRSQYRVCLRTAIRTAINLLTGACAGVQAMLEELFSSGRGHLHLRTMWHDVESRVSSDDRFLALQKSSPSAPQTLFDDFCDDLEDRLASDRKLLKQALKDERIEIEHNSKVDDLTAKLKVSICLMLIYIISISFV